MKMTTVTNEWRDMIVPISLKTGGTKTIDAMVYGCFAMHIVLVKDQRVWAVSHIPTGLQLNTYPDAATFYDMTPMVKALQAAHGDKWNTGNVARVKRMALECKDIWQIKEAVQS